MQSQICSPCSLLEIDGHSYTISSLIDDGISSEVYLMEDNSNHEEYAVKILKPEKANSCIAQFIMEELILRNLSNPFIVKYVSSGKCSITDEETKTKKYYFCIITKYLPNKSLIDYLIMPNLTGRGLGELNSKLIFFDILQGIKYLHDQEISHRDIKPDNIVFNDDFKPVVIDFGTSRKSGGDIPDICPKCGTKCYRPPEIFTISKDLQTNIKFSNIYNGRQYDPLKADIFSLGATLFVTVTGKLCFNEIEELNYLRKHKTNLYFSHILKNKLPEFWEIIERNSIELSTLFKELFIKMVNLLPELRPTIDEVINDPWFDEIRNMDETALNKAKDNLKEVLKCLKE